ncbi:universal stress protein A-like protein [Carica papaya]|uniref:universal stress protein A-like protein n=1 Tax=Carica papaya TaxID=3649 RepID=UPI000B8CFAF5|nr:universal stress protein A-like protein [Carica papaya]
MEATSGVVAGARTVMEQQQQQPLMEQTMRKKMKVMVAIDDSDYSFYALKWAIDNLFGAMGVTPEASQEGGMLTLLHAQEPFHQLAFPAGPGGATAFYASSSVLDSVRKAQEENSAAILARALKVCRDQNINAETLIMEGEPKDVICDAVEEMKIDLLVVGSRGLGKFKRAFLGSVSDHCAHHAKCPILIVRPPKGLKP